LQEQAAAVVGLAAAAEQVDIDQLLHIRLAPTKQLQLVEVVQDHLLELEVLVLLLH
jgi:hypothetical protein